MVNSKQPNILFLFPDQHRPDWLGANPDLPLRTPYIDRLMERGVTFTQAYSPAPVCAPARACLASGRDYDHCGVPSNQYIYPLDQPTYFQRLRDAGYRVCGVGKFDLHKGSTDPDWEMTWNLDGSHSLDAWGFTEGIDNEGKLNGSKVYRAEGKPKGPYMHFLQQQGLVDIYVKEHAERRDHQDAYVTALPDDAYCDNWLSENGLRFLKDFPKGQPWHLVVNFTGPHNPMDVTVRMRDAWEGVEFPMPVDNAQENYTEEDHQRNRRYYAAMVENIDRQVGRFIGAVEARGELDNTLIVYSSDHGEMLGDHGRWGKSTWYDPSARVPLVVAGPGVAQGITRDALVSLHDLTATYLDYAGTPPLPEMESRSLRGLLEGKTEEHRDFIKSALAHWRMVYDGRYKLAVEGDGPPKLFDLQKDPNELEDIADQLPDVVERLRKLL